MISTPLREATGKGRPTRPIQALKAKCRRLPATCRAWAWSLLTLMSATVAMSAEAPRASTVQGDVEGVLLGEVEAFLGIPFAQAPLGALRWRPPAPPAAWAGVRPTREFGAACMQDEPRPWGPFTTEFVELRAPRSEDCLFLNVWTPRTRTAQGLPVLVWIHGGGYGSGAASVPIYDGAHLAARGVVVVSVNYRLGVFGFLSHPALSEESPLKVSGNYGLLDIVAALRWVQANAARFGGRPDQVTIAGQSAGAAAVTNLLAMPSAQGLFSRAIAMSGAAMGVRPLPLAEGERAGGALLREAGVAGLDELRRRPAEQVQALKPKVDAAGGVPRLLMAPVVDGQLLPLDVETASARLASPVPVLSGYMGDEGFVMGPPAATPASFRAHVVMRYGDWAERFLALYPHTDDAQATASMRQIARDRYMAALVLWAQRRARQGQVVQGYLFSHPIPGPDAPRLGAFHTGEVPYLFGVLDRRRRPYTNEDTALAEALQQQVLAFMRTGRLLESGTALDAKTPTVLKFDGPTPARAVAVPGPGRLQLFADYEAAGGRLSMF